MLITDPTILLFHPNNSIDLAVKIEWLLKHPVKRNETKCIVRTEGSLRPNIQEKQTIVG